MAKKKIIDVFVNKDWEFEPFIEMIKKSDYLGKNIKENLFVRHPLLKREDRKYPNKPSAIYEDDSFIVNFRCIAYLAAADIGNDEIEYEGRCTDSKFRGVIKAIIDDAPDYIISVSTAESTNTNGLDDNLNGSVIMGRNFFLSDEREIDRDNRFGVKYYETGNPFKQEYKWPDMPFCEEGYAFIECKEDEEFFDRIKRINQKEIELYDAEFNPGSTKIVVYNERYTSIGVQNVSNYKSYPKADPDACEKFKKRREKYFRAVCIETAHGVVAYAAVLEEIGCMKTEMTSKIPIVFVSPIVDRYEHFNEDVKDYQNRIGGMNGGIVVAELLKLLTEKGGE